MTAGHTGVVGWYREHVLPRMANVLLGLSEFKPLRARVGGGLEGDVLEIGFGSGLNVLHYPPAVRKVWAVDPATVGRKLAAGRLAASPVPVELRVHGGCHLNRPIDEFVRSSGLDITRLETFYLKGPKPFGYMFEGIATKRGGWWESSPSARMPAAGRYTERKVARGVPCPPTSTTSSSPGRARSMSRPSARRRRRPGCRSSRATSP